MPIGLFVFKKLILKKISAGDIKSMKTFMMSFIIVVGIKAQITTAKIYIFLSSLLHAVGLSKGMPHPHIFIKT